MKIRDLMIPNPITIRPNASIQEALEVMKIYSIRHLPVVTDQNRLKGLLTLADLRQGLIPSMVGNLSLRDLMISKPVTVKPDDDVEYAAQLIYKRKIGGLPVVDSSRLVGIITESDILRAFIDMMGILASSSRIDVTVGKSPGEFQRVVQIIQQQGGDIINVGMSMPPTKFKTYYFRLTACDTAPIQKALEAAGLQVLT